MRRTSIKIIMIAAAAIFLLAACNKEEKQRQRLDGKWIYEKACWQEKLFRRTNILDDYLYIDAYFTEDGKVTFIDVKDSLVFEGKYSLDDETDVFFTDENGNQIPIVKTQMLLNYTDTASKENYQELWDNVEIGKNKIRYETEIDNKRAYFVLRRQPF